VALRISIREAGEVTILDLLGRSTTNDGESELLRAQFEKLISEGARFFLLNLSDLTQIDSSGVSAIVKTCMRLRGQGGDLKFLRPRVHAREVFRVLHLLDVIPTFEDETEALESFRILRQPAKS
jgi:anti-anti-sigma factor